MADDMSRGERRLAAGPEPLTWIVCDRTRRIANIMATGERRLLRWEKPRTAEDSGTSTGQVTLRDDGLWQEWGPGNKIACGPDGRQHVVAVTPPPPPQQVPVVEIGCSRHGRHLVDGQRLARHMRTTPRRINVTDVTPLG
jgi:hypothetical protein